MRDNCVNMSHLVTKKTFVSILVVMTLTIVGGLTLTSKKADAACAAQDTSRGSVTSSFSVTQAGTYSVKSRIQANGTNDSFILEIDGTTCGVKVGNANTGATGWQWIDYRDGNTASKFTVTLAAGTHSMTMIGTEDNVQVDRVLFLSDAACVPSGTGDNCANVDNTPPSQAAITSPANNSTITGTTLLTATGTDETGIAKIEFYMGTSLLGTASSSPYTYPLNTSLYPAGTYSLTAKAYDAAGNSKTSSIVTVTIPPPPDTTAPSVTITSPVNGSTVNGSITMSATATDASGISKVEVSVGSTLVKTLTTSPYTFTYDTKSVADGNYTITFKAYDAAATPNVTAKTAAVTIKNSVPAATCDFDGDGKVGVIDLSKLLSNYGKAVTAGTNGDCDNNGTVNVTDLSMMLTRYGQ